MLNMHDRAPNLDLTTPSGALISLSETWRNGRSVLLVFLRHLG